MTFKVQKNASSKHYKFGGEVRIHKDVVAAMEGANALPELFSILEDVKKRAAKDKGLTDPQQFYESDQSGIQLVIIDKISVEELEDTEIPTLQKNRNNICQIKLA